MLPTQKLRHLLTALLLAVAATAAAYTVSGTVTDSDGEPLIGASARLFAPRDTTRVLKTAVADENGRFTFNNVSNGTYVLDLTYVGYEAAKKRINVRGANLTVPKTVLASGAIALREAVVTGIRTPVKVMEDTVEFNADTYKTQPNAVVEDLLKRLPGVEVGTDGSITANGKTVTKILVDGKEFFADDPKVASKNLPVNMVDKLQVVDRKSDLARLTGVDDGEEETVINLTVKKGMKNGWFGNAEAGVGTDSRYKGSFTVNRFWNDNQITVLGGLNNINEPGFTDGASGRFRRFGGDNGITLSKALGLNFNVGNKEIFRVGGNVMYSHTSARTISSQERQYVIPDNESFLSSSKYAHDKGHNFRADFRIQWNPDSFNTFEFRPRMMYNQNDSRSIDSSLNQSALHEDITRSLNRQTSDGKSWEFGAELIYNHKFRSRPGRSFSVQARFQSSNVRTHESTYSWNKFFLYNDSIDLYDQYADDHTWSNTVNGRLSWTEPLGDVKKGNFLTIAYSVRYRWNNADKMVYDHPVSFPDGWLGDPVISDELSLREDLSNRFRNDYMNQDIRLGYKHVDKKNNLDVGLSLVPQSSKSIDLINHDRDITRHVLNFAPYLRFRRKFTKTRSLTLNYRGRSSQPSMTQLQPVADYSDPMRIVIGNPALDPTFTHNIRLRLQNFNQQSQRSLMVMADAQIAQNSIVSRTSFDSSTGGQTTTYENVNGVWNVMGMTMYSMPLRNKSWVFNAHAFGRYSHDVGFMNGARNLSQSLNLNVMPSIAWRPAHLELEVRPRYGLQTSRNSVSTQGNQTVHSYGGMFNGTFYTDFGLTLSTDLNYTRTSGRAAGYNTNSCLWNATLSYSMLRDQSLTLSLHAYDLLQQKDNTRRTINAQYIDDTMYNSLTRYFMVSVSWKFNTFGKGNEPESRNDWRRGPHGPGGPPPGMGGGRRRM